MKRSVLAFLFLFLVGSFLQAQNLKIHHINVGQGDATLLVSPTGKTMLIDAGGNGMGTSNVLPYILSLGVTQLDYVVATHLHADHIGGLDEVINGLGGAKVGTVYDRGTVHAPPTSAVYSAYLAAANSAAGGHQTLTVGQIIDLGGGVSVKCVATDGQVLGFGTVPNATSSENDLSNAWVVSYGDFRYFTGGDCGGETAAYADLETPIADAVGIVDAFKVDHHGSVYSTNPYFFGKLQPTSAVIMVGDGNSYKHPVQAVLDRLVGGNCYTYLTETGNGGTIATGKGAVADGNILISTTGTNNYTVSYGSVSNTYALHNQSTNVSVSVSPASASLTANGTKQFAATVVGSTTTSVTWTCTGGSITNTGLYTAPSIAGNYTVTAVSVADATKSASAAVTVTPMATVSVAINPTSASLLAAGKQQFTATVSNTNNTSVTWTCTGGSITTGGLYTAPSIAGTYTVKAVSVADTTKSASATVTVTLNTTFREVESNNSIGTANVVGTSFTKIVGYFPSTSDNDDFFAVTLLAGRTLTVNMTGPTSTSLDYDLYLNSSAGTQLAKSENTGSTESVSYKNTNSSASKTIYIKVHRYAGSSSASPYTLTFTR
ncbi:MAG: MBL fold metallo-hydrolase [Rectinemataceae bacterium]|nr:MBL fold metallo-hydrolase [Rectinemataceae bacterium]